MRRVPMAGPALIVLAIVAATPAQASHGKTTEAVEVQSSGLLRLALNPQPEPPGKSAKYWKKAKPMKKVPPVVKGKSK